MRPMTELQASGPRALERRPPSWLSQAAILFRKDALIELRTGEVLVTSGFFAVLVVVLGSLAFYLGPDTRTQVAAGVIWLAVAFAAVLALGRLWQRERDEGALEGVLTAPVSRSAIFAGKAVGLLAFLGLIELVVVPLSILFFALDLSKVGVGLLAITAFATPGVAATGTLFGAMTARTRARDLVLAVVLFPLLSPTLLTAVVATRELFGGTPLSELGDYFRILGVFDVAFTAGGLALFGTLVDA
jgi:heme exporter protein B